MRRAFVDTLTDMAGKDDRIVFLTGDLGFQMFDTFIERYGPRYINVGIAEAELVCAAAGLAQVGFRPFAYSIASFMTARPYEQIRYTVGYPGLPVVIVGAGGGYCYSASGVSHHAADDFALMGLIPGMTVVAPGDPNEIRALLPQLTALPGPAYLRVGKFGEPTYESPAPILLGRARLLQEGERIAILTAGETAPLALEAVRRLAEEGLRPTLCHFHTLKPLDTDALDRLLPSHRRFICVEECYPRGGLHSALLEWSQNAPSPVRIERLGPGDAFALGNPKLDALRAGMGFDAAAIAAACRRAWATPANPQGAS